VSILSIPALSKSQTKDSVSADILSRQWRYNYEAGKARAPPVAVTVGASLSYLAWCVRSGTQLHSLAPKNSAQFYGTAAILVIGIIPYTLLAMSSTNAKLMARAELNLSSSKNTSAATALDDKEVGELLKTWIVLNNVRSIFPLLGSIAALAAVLA
jgi:hypothetical protein